MEPMNTQSDERLWASLAHLSTFSGYLIPMGHVIGPLIVYLVQKDKSEFAADQAKESLNFQITMTLYLVIALILCLIVIGFPILLGLIVFELVCVIQATIKAKDGQVYRYPLTFRLVG